ncbi:hypothetical protein Kpol_1023p47 [Vanderwaltozyma polyspora DSM 70294]|uniref:Fatty acid hydroxylase domain-containing protein n=1 Tax=Vanderwaltozyma polyspora (strain ATCC 22028 / DSM 70294 / BCRC 21397 / CBS 2163 / NBRC 10782 / NRRL Y-8283 / UCD 57-17) TaxID=436907 RepID=A7TFS0_VANPO|nr:uncharacterized protein Kpol_1023p47 [Vanderwaltozyma polyspora DSM 70294]EDO18878.1 hypothetical protein Kpol_1023p47 [Vanderwaltozyma polyspora DSM 70294]
MSSNSTLLEIQPGFSFMDSIKAPVPVIVEKNSILSNMTDGMLALVIPVVAYWAFSIFFHIIDTFQLAEQYRIHPSEEVAKRNKASRMDVLSEVIFQHIMQTVVGLAFIHFDPLPTTGFEMNEMWKLRQSIPSFVPNIAVYYLYTYGFSIIKISLGFVFVDTWQYWLHRLMHTNMTLYRKFHSRHHRLYVPYAYGALYNAPLEGFLLDTLGTGIAMVLTGLTYREQMFFYTFATLKTVDDHCGYALPWDPFQMFFPNNSVYHDIHHQNFGIKTNYAQPFFTFWDTLFSTNFKGIEDYQKKQKKITIDKYREFLASREEERKKTK